MQRIQLAEGHEISRILKGHWQVAGGHGAIDQAQAIEDLFAFVDSGITTFDCADIYTGAEELIGAFLKQYEERYGTEARKLIKVHDKFVPDLAMLPDVSMEYVESIIDRSLERLGLDAIDLVQFHWWDYSVARYIETVGYLKQLQDKGKIRHIGVTNFDLAHLNEILDSGVTLVSAQIQYSVLDQRPEGAFAKFCAAHNIKLLCYGSLAGGFLGERYLGAVEPMEPLENRSLIKYKLIIEEFGGWSAFQKLLSALHEIGHKHNVSLANVAMRYVLDKPTVAGIIVGARNSSHLADIVKVFDFELDADDMKQIQLMIESAHKIPGEVYELERDKNGRHGSIMKYNLNKK
ncbi:MAG: aldo/keto reductase [Patescibacteria group bacterium]